MSAKSVTIIDRYLARQFIQLFLMSYVSLAGLYTVVDAFTNLDSFIAFAEKEGNLAAIMLRFYAFRWLAFFDLTSGVLALVAATFTITLFQSRNEMTALLAAGIAKRRICMPVIVAGAAVSLLAAGARELVLPRYARELSQNAKDLSGDAGQPVSPRYDNRTEILLNGGVTIPKRQCIKKPNFQLPSDGLLDRYGRYLIAEEAFYQRPTPDRPGGYRLKRVQQPAGLTQQPSLIGRSGDPVVLCPSDTPWLAEGECFVISDVDFEQLSGQAAWRHWSTAQLVGVVHNKSLDYGADVKVAIHSRIVKPLWDFNLLLLGLPLILSRDNRNVFLAVGLCLGATMAFLIAIYGSQFLGDAVYISPHLAAWLPLMIFVPSAAALVRPLLE
jgi:lipopolysaccharide export system permease protein